MKTNALSLLLLFVCMISLSAQEPLIFTFDGVNKTRMEAATNGRLFWNGESGQFSQEANGVNMMELAGLWMAGFNPAGNLKGLIQEFDENGGDFQSGLLDPNTQEIIGANQIWRVTAQEVADHIQDFEADGIIDNPQASIFSWPGLGNAWFFDFNGYEMPQDIFPLASFWDINGNGIYEPNSGDYPILEIRNCDTPIVPSEMIWFVAHNQTVTESGFLPQQMEVQTTLFAFDCTQVPGIDQSVYARYKLINRDEETIDSTYVGLLSSFTVGDTNSDYFGANSPWNMIYGYNSTDDDPAFGDFSGPLVVPSVVTTKLIRGPLNEVGQEQDMESVMPVFYPEDHPDLPSGMLAPSSPVEYYRYLTGHWRDGTPLTEGGNGYQSGGEVTNIAFPDRPEVTSGWSESTAANEPGPRAALGSYGPFTLFPGAVNEFVVSFTISKNLEATNVGDQIDQAFADIAVVQNLFDNCFDGTQLGCMVTSVSEQANLNQQLRIFPNPATDEVTLLLEGEAMAAIQIITTAGKVVLSQNGKWHQHSLDVSHLPKGVYFVRVQTEKGQLANQKLVIF